MRIIVKSEESTRTEQPAKDSLLNIYRHACSDRRKWTTLWPACRLLMVRFSGDVRRCSRLSWILLVCVVIEYIKIIHVAHTKRMAHIMHDLFRQCAEHEIVKCLKNKAHLYESFQGSDASVSRHGNGFRRLQFFLHAYVCIAAFRCKLRQHARYTLSYMYALIIFHIYTHMRSVHGWWCRQSYNQSLLDVDGVSGINYTSAVLHPNMHGI